MNMTQSATGASQGLMALAATGFSGLKDSDHGIVTGAVDEDRWRNSHAFTQPNLLPEEEHAIGIMADTDGSTRSWNFHDGPRSPSTAR
jgi:hypothetical protein